MATWHIKTTGTRSSGASTAGNWTDANCYPNVAAIDDTVLAGGDTIIFDDDVHVFGGTVTLNSMPTAGTITWQSRSANASSCVLMFTELASCTLLINNAVAAQNHLFENVTITLRGTHIGSATRRSATIQFGGSVGDVTFRRVTFRDMNVDWRTTTSGAEGMFMDYAVGASGTKTLWFDTCDFNDIILRGPVGGGSAINGRTGCSVFRMTDCAFRRWTVENAEGSHGVFRTQTGQLDIRRVTVDGVSVAGDNWNGFFFHSTNGIMAVFDDVLFRRVTLVGDAHPAMVQCQDPFRVSNLRGELIDFQSSNNSAGLGGVFLATSATAQGSVEGIFGREVTQHYGATFYFSNGAGGTVRGLFADGNAGIQGAGFYIGGMDAYCSVVDASVNWCRHIKEPTMEGAAVYCHQKNVATSARTIDLRALRVLNTVPLSPSVRPIRLSAQDAGSALTVNIREGVFRNPRFTAGEIEFHALSTCTLHYNAISNNVHGGASNLIETGSGTHNPSVSGTTDTDVRLARMGRVRGRPPALYRVR